MHVVVALDFRFEATPDGSIWSSTAYSHTFWQRYLDVFDGVRIVARAASVQEPQPGDRRVDGPSVEFLPVPFYLGPAQYLLRARQIRRAAHRAIGEHDAVILRVGSQLANCLTQVLWRSRRPYGLEVVGDPQDAFAPRAIRHPLRPFLRWRNTRVLRRQCANACGAAYVTESALQSRYPCPQFQAAVSDVDLTGNFSTGSPVTTHSSLGERRLVFVGSLEQMYKGPDVLLDALAICLRANPAFRLTLIGEGRHLPELKVQAAALGIQEHVRFTGRLASGEAIQKELDRSSLFVLPSRTEGLPRAMVEAMARGLPCVGTEVGGIPELLAAEDTVPAGCARSLARKILEVTSDPNRMRHMSDRNFQNAMRFREELLSPRRIGFYRHVKDVTTQWLSNREQSGLQGVTGNARFARYENI
jgi:glycosyltransferase involved in cell wall biosynthesis